MNTLIDQIRPLARDLLILVTGIMLSLLLNEWRENRIARIDENRVMDQLIEDLQTDTLVLGLTQRTMEVLAGYADFVMSEDARQPDSLIKANIMLWQMASFTPMPLQQTALNELKYQGQHRNIRRPEIVSRTINLHEGSYELLRRVVNMHGDYLLEDLVPWYNVTLPNHKGPELTPAEQARMSELLLTDELQNRVFWIKILMTNVEAAISQSKTMAEELLLDVEEEYGE